jgi:hypothetical protein
MEKVSEEKDDEIMKKEINIESLLFFCNDNKGEDYSFKVDLLGLETMRIDGCIREDRDCYIQLAFKYDGLIYEDKTLGKEIQFDVYPPSKTIGIFNDNGTKKLTFFIKDLNGKECYADCSREVAPELHTFDKGTDYESVKAILKTGLVDGWLKGNFKDVYFT